MRENYRAQCRWAANDFLNAYRVGDSVHVDAYNDNEEKANASLPVAEARAFARGILALADEVDGGEARSEARPRVGDRLRVTKDNPRSCPVVVGDIITVVETDYGHDGEDCVRFVWPGSDYRWFIPVSAVQRVGADTEPASVAEPLKVGSRVRVVRAEDPGVTRSFVGRVGTLTEIDSHDPRMPYLVRFGDGEHGADDGAWWCGAVEPVNESPADVTDVATVDAERAARLELLEAAKRLAPGGNVDDWMRIAAYLEGN
ncbi:hypothetical protein AB0D97_14270 [Streptomyces roseus]|uniref:hypothetical protein n=1 Tax=Streptomyces roseus TaxID=66430 RepID=UPI003407B79D